MMGMYLQLGGKFYVHFLIRFLVFIQLYSSTSGKVVLHDSSFLPHATLRVTKQEVTQSCITKPGVVLVNGTSPGPEIRLIEGQVFWIRVYNDIDNDNLTMVLAFQFLFREVS